MLERDVRVILRIVAAAASRAGLPHGCATATGVDQR